MRMNLAGKTRSTATVKKVRAERWLEENIASLDAYNAYIKEHGLPLEKYRLF